MLMRTWCMCAGPVFGAAETFTGLGLFFDTYSNHNGPHHHRHPYISAMVSDGETRYDHDTDGTHTQLAGCEADFRNLDHPTRVRVIYVDMVLQVLTDFTGNNDWKQCFVSKDVYLPAGFHLAFSAATGDVADNHDIISVRTTQIPGTPSAPGPAQPDPGIDSLRRAQEMEAQRPFAKHAEAPRDHISDEPQRTQAESLFGVLVLAVEVVIGLALVGVIVLFVRMQMKAKAAKHFS